MFSRKFCLFEHCWGRLIKKSIVKEHKIKFDEKLNQLEDILFNSTVLKKATKISIEPTPLYNHVLYGSNERLSNKAGENIPPNKLSLMHIIVKKVLPINKNIT